MFLSRSCFQVELQLQSVISSSIRRSYRPSLPPASPAMPLHYCSPASVSRARLSTKLLLPCANPSRSISLQRPFSCSSPVLSPASRVPGQRWGSRARLSRQSRTTLSHTTANSFSSSTTAMAAIKIDGNAIAKSIREKLHAQVAETQKSNPRYKPSLKIIQGDSLNLQGPETES